MQKQPRILPSQKIPEKLLRLTRAALDIDRAEYRDDVLEKKLGIIAAAVLQSLLTRPWGCGLLSLRRRAQFTSTPTDPLVVFCGGELGRGVEKGEYFEFAPDPFARARDKLLLAVEAVGRELAVLGETVGADAQGVELVAVDVLASAEGVVARLGLEWWSIRGASSAARATGWVMVDGWCGWMG